jgi:hypothetical protein
MGHGGLPGYYTQTTIYHMVPKYLIRIYIFLSLLIVTPSGFIFKFFQGPASWWFNNYGAGVLYEVFWILVIFFLFPNKKSVRPIPLWVFTITSGLEFLQLWHPCFLEEIRSHFLGSVFIGTSFTWWDFPHYAIGCIIGWGWMKYLLKKT